MFAYRHDILKALIADGAKLVVLGRNEKLSNLPEFKNATITDIDLTARFADYSPDKKLMVVGEENVLGNPNDSGVGSCEVIREFAKALYLVCGTRPIDPNWNNRGREVQQYELRVKRIDVQFDDRLKQLYDSAMSNKKWQGTPAVRSRTEYWAEGVLAYFDATGQEGIPNDAPHPIAARELLKEYDPDLFALVNETMAYDGHVDWRYTRF
jgi:alpha-glucosidase